MQEFELITNIDVVNMFIASLTMVAIGAFIFIKRRITEYKRRGKN